MGDETNENDVCCACGQEADFIQFALLGVSEAYCEACYQRLGEAEE